MNRIRGTVSLGLLVLAVVGIIGVFFAPLASAASCSGVDTAIISCDQNANGVLEIVKLVLKILTGLVGIAAVGALIFAGILYSSASGEQSQVQKAKTMIQNTVIGIILFGTMFLVGNWLIPGGVFGGDIGNNGSGINDSAATGSGSTTPEAEGGQFKELTSFVMATWNTRGDNPSNIGTKVKSTDADIIGLQEVHQTNHRNQLKDIACSGCAYNIQFGGSGSKGSDPILWNRSKFSKVDNGVSYMSSPAGYTVRYATWVKLKDKETNKQFYVINTHTPPGVEKGSGWSDRSSMVSAYKEHLKNLASLVKSKKTTGLAVFVTGDFNVDYRDDKNCKISEWACLKISKPYGIYPAWYYTQFSGIAKSQGTLNNSSRLIDYVMAPATSDIRVKSASVIGGNSNGWGGSDHKPSLATISLGEKITSSAPSTSSTTLSGVENFRDVAALTPSIVKPGLLYRSAKLQNATSDDRSKLTTLLKNGEIIDLRTPTTRKASPDKPVSGINNVNYPIEGVSDAKGYVRAYVTSKDGRASFGKAITDIATTQGAVLVHCTAGKDRTGWIVAMVMYALGANNDQVMKEYLKSKDAGADFKVNAAWFNAAYAAAIDKDHGNGSILDYIKNPVSNGGLGVSEDTLTKLKQKLGA